jgi:hypothetical protein
MDRERAGLRLHDLTETASGKTQRFSAVTDHFILGWYGTLLVIVFARYAFGYQ